MPNNHTTLENQKIISVFELIQLGKPKSVKLQKIGDDSIYFEANVQMTDDDFNSLFNYCKNNWNEKKYADIEHKGLKQDGIPINPIFKGIKTKL